MGDLPRDSASLHLRLRAWQVYLLKNLYKEAKLFFKSMKGISPLIATVLLIAFVIAVAGVVAPWLTTFIRGRTEEVSESVEKLCRGPRIDFTSEDITNKSVENYILVRVDNTGIDKLEDFAVAAIGAEMVNTTKFLGVIIESGRTHIFKADCSPPNNIVAVRVTPGNCPMAVREVEVDKAC